MADTALGFVVQIGFPACSLYGSLQERIGLTIHSSRRRFAARLNSGVRPHMWIFGKRSKLLRQLDRLAFYNDKGIDYARHNPAQVLTEQALGLAKIRALVAAIGPSSFPDSFIAAVDSGAIATDLTGQYIDLLKAHFRSHRGAP